MSQSDYRILDARNRAIEVLPTTDIDGKAIGHYSCLRKAKVSELAVADYPQSYDEAKSTENVYKYMHLAGSSLKIKVPRYVNPNDDIIYRRLNEHEVSYVAAPKYTGFDLAFRTLHHPGDNAEYFARTLITLACSNLEVCDQKPDKDYNLIEYLMHGGRVNYDLAALSNSEREKFIDLFAPGMQERLAASHTLVEDNQNNLREKKVRGLAAFAPRTHWGIDFAIGGTGGFTVKRRSQSGKVEEQQVSPQATGSHGHIYVHCAMPQASAVARTSRQKKWRYRIANVFSPFKRRFSTAGRFMRGVFRRSAPVAPETVAEFTYPRGIAIGIEPSGSAKANEFTGESHSMLGSAGRLSPFLQEKIDRHDSCGRADFVQPGQKYNNFMVKVTSSNLQQILRNCGNPQHDQTQQMALHTKNTACRNALEFMFKHHPQAQQVQDRPARRQSMHDYHATLGRDGWFRSHDGLGGRISTVRNLPPAEVPTQTPIPGSARPSE